jgi:inosine/xanthosine triphosphate pyrophosphatase family protein
MDKKIYKIKDELIVATHNEGKVVEIARLLKGKVENVHTCNDLGLEDVEETGVTPLWNKRKIL